MNRFKANRPDNFPKEVREDGRTGGPRTPLRHCRSWRETSKKDWEGTADREEENQQRCLGSLVKKVWAGRIVGRPLRKLKGCIQTTGGTK